MLSDWAPFTYFHAKNVDALLQIILLKNSNFKVFSHDKDDYTLTSDCRIWVYPGRKLVPGSICVMPERQPDQGE